MSDHTVTCTINNHCTDPIGYSTESANNGTTWVNTTSTDNNDIDPNGTGGFTASGGMTHGCGGSVKYTLPNNDILLILYNTSTGFENAYCVPLLQPDPKSTNSGSSEYYCSVTNVSSTTDDEISCTIDVYEQP